ncbi:GRAS family protein [Myxococcus landrumensis]|uniref:GAI protein2C n=1 Tax=Myxococcus landrumensis TaxID=2813577 RepID=A0ABX7N3T6_9BACT|nr:GRAS family protein [Myxococcus landrumus]QSQ12325.1 GAI protein2C [Myxococcus landrumus]
MRTSKDELLFRAMEHAVAGRAVEARRALSSLESRLQVDVVPEDLGYHLFAMAVAHRLEGSGARNPYLNPRVEEGGRQIDLFRSLMTYMPLAATADVLANAVLEELLGTRGEATLVDVGIGQGRQEARLLRLLSRRGVLPRRLTLVGVDPSGASLEQAESTVAKVASEVGGTVRFLGVEAPVEEVSEATWSKLRELPGPRVVNAAFAMHHVAEQPGRAGAARDEVLRHLRGLDPVGLVLSEPNTDHFGASPLVRFEHAWRHFTHVFQLLDTLGVPSEERAAIKRFFGREVEDVVGTVDEAARCERHETAATWMERLRRAGFVPLELLERVRPEGVHPALTLRREPGLVGLSWREEMLVAVLAVRPDIARA